MSDSHEILSSKVADSMMQRIIDNEYRAGNFLPSERVLQDEYQVSRTVIREAIKLLVAWNIPATICRCCVSACKILSRGRDFAKKIALQTSLSALFTASA